MAPKKSTAADSKQKETKKETPLPKKEAKPAPKAKPEPKKQPADKKPVPKKQEEEPQATTAKQCVQPNPRIPVGVYVRGLDFEGMNKETVKEIFAPCGKVVQVQLRHTKWNVAIVFFEKASQGNRALEMDGKVVKGRKIKVRTSTVAPKLARNTYCTTVWVGKLPGGSTKYQVRDHFAKAGEIIKVRIYKKTHSAYVYFKTVADAVAAVKMSDQPFSFGRDTTGMKYIPLEWQRKLEVKLSKRTRAGDKLRAKKRYNRRPPSMIAKAEEKSQHRAALRRARKEGKDKKKTTSEKKSSEKKTAEKAGEKKSSGKKGEKKEAPAKDTKKGKKGAQ